MRILALIWHYLIPHFTTSYYVYGVTDTGHQVLMILRGPEDVDEDQRQFVFGASYLLFWGRPFFTRFFHFSD